MVNENKQYIIDNYFGWQRNVPVFVKTPFPSFGKVWQKGEEFNWMDQQFREEDWFDVCKNTQTLYNQGFIHHDSAREKETKVGDRLNEMNGEQLYRLVTQLNADVKSRTTSAQEFKDKKCKISKVDTKQRGQIRRWLRSNTWAQDNFYQYRDTILGE